MIRKIARETFEYCIDKHSNSTGPIPWVWEEKFAELIIEECAKIAEDASKLRMPASTYGDLIRKFKRL